MGPWMNQDLTCLVAGSQFPKQYCCRRRCCCWELGTLWWRRHDGDARCSTSSKKKHDNWTSPITRLQLNCRLIGNEHKTGVDCPPCLRCPIYVRRRMRLRRFRLCDGKWPEIVQVMPRIFWWTRMLWSRIKELCHGCWWLHKVKWDFEWRTGHPCWWSLDHHASFLHEEFRSNMERRTRRIWFAVNVEARQN